MTVDYKNHLAKVMNMYSRFEVENSADSELKLYIYGYIGGWENSAERILRKIEQSDAKTIHVHINSGGGSAFDGVAICNLLKNHKAEIIIHIDGWAASAASIIAMSGDKIIMPSNTMMMIHEASMFIYGNADYLEKTAKDLRKVDKAVSASYQSRFIGSEEELSKLLKEETWLTADEAVALGLADEVTDEIEIEKIEEEEEPENIKDSLVAKYMKEKSNNQKNKEPKQDPVETKRNLSRLFI